ncbi:MAG: class I SAM-dependent methyltransferase [Chakrabartia godavariana]
MTSRNTTSALARADAITVERTPADWARLLGFGAVQWPWLLKSLYGGRKADKATLLQRLSLPDDALPHLGSWKADTGLLHHIVDTILRERPGVVVELGAGASTLVAAQALKLAGSSGRLVSFDQHGEFVGAVRDWLADHDLRADVRHAPLVAHDGRWSGLWYDLHGIPDTIDLLLIDGPPWALGPTIRAGAARLFARVPVGGIVMLDDAARPGERLVARHWRRDWPGFDWQLMPGIKGTLVGVRRF